MRKLLVISLFVLLIVSAFSEVIPIAQIYKLNGSETVEATGVVLVEPNALMNKTTWIQDSSAGIMIYGNLPTFKLGDVIKITGKTKLYYGILEILPDKIEVIGKSEVKPVNLNELFKELAEQNDGKISSQKISETFYSVMSMLVTLEGTISSIEKQKFTVTTEYFEILVYLRKEANVSTKDLRKGDKVSVTGIMYLYNGTFEILPRNQQDVVKK